MNTITRRIAAGAALAIAPALIALGAAGTSQADTGSTTGDYPVHTAPQHPSKAPVCHHHGPHRHHCHHWG